MNFCKQRLSGHKTSIENSFVIVSITLRVLDKSRALCRKMLWLPVHHEYIGEAKLNSAVLDLTR